MKNIIFHHPLPLNPNATSASGIRPIKILEAFQDLGYEVFLVTGYVEERKKRIKLLKEVIQKGIKYDFCYSESSTMPTALTEPHHLPIAPFLDFDFFKFLNKHNIPIGLFYRDIYWLFDEYDTHLPKWKSLISKLFYRYDLKQYEKTLTKLYLPSIEMGRYIPYVSEEKHKALPPGYTPVKVDTTLPLEERAKIELLYIGGISSHYQMHKLFNVLAQFSKDDVHFTLCTRAEEWNTMHHEYPSPLPDNIQIVHKSGLELQPLYNKTDIAMLFVKPQEYWEFASPVKLYEYLGEHKPIIATQGTLAGSFVEQNNIGWNIPYTEEALFKLLNDLLQTPSLLNKIKTQTKLVAEQHSWKARAQQVINDLTRVNTL